MIPSCSICGDLFTGISPEIIHVTKCGHLFHLECLSKWIARSKTCPQCRATVIEGQTIRVYMEGSSIIGSSENPAVLTNRVDSLNFQITLKDTELKKVHAELLKEKNISELLRKDLKSTKKELESTLRNMQVLHDYVKEKKGLKEQLKKQTDQITCLKNELKTYEKVGKILKGSNEQASEAIKSLKDLTNQEITEACISALKRELKEYKERHSKAQTQIAQLRMNLDNSNSEYRKCEIQRQRIHNQQSTCNNENRETNIQQQAINNQYQYTRSEPSLRKHNEHRDLSLPERVETPLFASQPSNSSDAFLRLSPISPRLKGIKSRTMLLSKPRLDLKKRLPTTDCFDGLGGHSKEDSFDKIQLGVTNNKKCVPAVKKFKPSSQQTNLLSTFLKTAR